MVDNDPKSLDAPTRRDQVEGEGAIRGTARIEAFADAVFAIAFTLPVVAIIMPKPEEVGGRLSDDLAALSPAYIGYLLASLVIGLYFVRHHFSGAIFRSTGHWFVFATSVFLAAIGFIAFPARVIAEHFGDAAARPAAARYWVVSLAILSLTWLFKWSVGVSHGHIDSRLEREYVRGLTRHYQLVAALNVLAAMMVFLHWQSGLVLAAALVAWMIFPPDTPRYITEAPIIEGES